MTGNTLHEVKLVYVHHTPLAVLVESGNHEDAWMAFDLIETDEHVDTLDEGDTFTAEVPFWLLEKYNLDQLINWRT